MEYIEVDLYEHTNVHDRFNEKSIRYKRTDDSLRKYLTEGYEIVATIPVGSCTKVILGKEIEVDPNKRVTFDPDKRIEKD